LHSRRLTTGPEIAASKSIAAALGTMGNIACAILPAQPPDSGAFLDVGNLGNLN
jgi:hypothetical protein